MKARVQPRKVPVTVISRDLAEPIVVVKRAIHDVRERGRVATVRLWRRDHVATKDGVGWVVLA